MPLVLDELNQLAALGGSEGLGTRSVHHRGGVAIDDEHGAPHSQHAHQRPPFVERALQITDMKVLHAYTRREEDARRIAGVQADERAGCSLDLRRRRREIVATTQAGTAFRVGDADHGCRLRARRAAWRPPMPCTPPPGGVEDEHRYTPSIGVAQGCSEIVGRVKSWRRLPAPPLMSPPT